ncbi:hypothetical protein B0H19DRAFT_191008 [Mycena capillaripes]|nr:hypothetical protein B0H19DRAFT_191008 [Mycena capillaripes]
MSYTGAQSHIYLELRDDSRTSCGLLTVGADWKMHRQWSGKQLPTCNSFEVRSHLLLLKSRIGDLNPCASSGSVAAGLKDPALNLMASFSTALPSQFGNPGVLDVPAVHALCIAFGPSRTLVLWAGSNPRRVKIIQGSVGQTTYYKNVPSKTDTLAFFLEPPTQNRCATAALISTLHAASAFVAALTPPAGPLAPATPIATPAPTPVRTRGCGGGASVQAAGHCYRC